MKNFIFGFLALLLLVSTGVSIAKTSEARFESSEVSMLDEAASDCEKDQTECDNKFEKYRQEDKAGIICIDGECMQVSSGN